AGWFAWRERRPLWPVLVTAVAVGCVYVCRNVRYLAAMFVGERFVDYVSLALIALLVWLNRRRVADGVRLATPVPPLENRGPESSGTADPKPALSAAAEWLDPRRIVGGVKQGAAVTPQDDLRPYLFAGLNLALVLAAVIVVYDLQYFRDYRVMAPH